jgi:RimJ/RimL family protein N-acetyltransferase
MIGLRGDKVLLRALTRADLETLRGFVNDPDVMRTSNTFRPVSDFEQDAWWESLIKNSHAVWFGIEALDAPGRLVGTCCLVDIDAVARQAELRVRIGDRDAWGKGYATDACALLLAHAFERLNLHRVWLRVLEMNASAQRVYEKLGFAVEGRLRQSAFVDGAFRDTILMGILIDEWRGART